MQLVDLKPADYNPRKISDKAFAGLSASLERFGLANRIVWNKKSGKIIGGNQRYRALVEAGEREADVIVVNLPEDEEKTLNLALNNPATQGNWDDQIEDLLESTRNALPELYESLNFSELQESLSRPGKSNEEPEIMTCPCCSHKWVPEPSDFVSLEQ